MSLPADTLTAIFERTSALLTQGWCQHDYAQRADGSWVTVLSPDACRWSLAGALSTSLHEHHLAIAFPQVWARLSRHLPSGHRDPEEWQDLAMTSQQDVLALVERARKEGEK